MLTPFLDWKEMITLWPLAYQGALESHVPFGKAISAPLENPTPVQQKNILSQENRVLSDILDFTVVPKPYSKRLVISMADSPKSVSFHVTDLVQLRTD